MANSKESEALSLEQFKQIMDKLSRLDNQIQEHFWNLTSEISTLRHEMKSECTWTQRRKLRGCSVWCNRKWHEYRYRRYPLQRSSWSCWETALRRCLQEIYETNSCFLSREDKDAVFRARNRLKDSSRAKDVYITQDYAKAVQQERKVLIEAMFQAK